MESTRYGDLGTPQRRNKFGGFKLTETSCGQPQALVTADFLEAFLKCKIFSQEQFNSAAQLCRDYEIGILRRWNTTADYLRNLGMPTENSHDVQEEARACYNHAIRWNPSFLAISALTDHVIDCDTPNKIARYKQQSEKMQRICDRLIVYYCTFNRDDVISKLRAS